MIETLFEDAAILMLFTLPVITALYSVIAGFIIKDKFIVSGIVVITYLILARYIFGKEFLAWIAVYTLLSICITWLLEIISDNRTKDKRIKSYS